MTENYWNKTKEQLIELIQKKDKEIDLMASQVFLTREQREEMEKYINNLDTRCKGFADFVKQYFKNKAEEEGEIWNKK